MHTDTPNTATTGTAGHTANARDIHGALEAPTELRALPTSGDRIKHVSAAPEPTGGTLSNMKTASADLVLSSTRSIWGRQMPLFDRNADIFDRIAALEVAIADPETNITELGADVIALAVDLATLEADLTAFDADLTAFEADLEVYQANIAAYEADPAARREGTADRPTYLAPILQCWRNRLNAIWGDPPIV